MLILCIYIVILLILFLYIQPNRVNSKKNSYSTKYGIVLSNVVDDNQKKLNEQLEDISQLGFKWVRIDFNWNFIQPVKADKFNWTAYDRIESTAKRYHLDVLGIIDYTPGWARSLSCKSSFTCMPNSSKQYASFAKDLVNRYKNYGSHDWEIWNEENVNKFWSPEPNPKNYVEILRQAYIAIKQADPKSYVLVGGLAYGANARPNGKNINATEFLEQLYRYGAANYFDALAYHPYTYPNAPSSADSVWSKISSSKPSLRSIMIDHGYSSKQIWLTEYGAPTNGKTGSNFVNENKQAQLAKDAVQAVKNKQWIGSLFWYTYQDNNTNNAEDFFGIRRIDNSKKPAYYIWKNIIKINN